jgi:hypothetical protein
MKLFPIIRSDFGFSPLGSLTTGITEESPVESCNSRIRVKKILVNII